MAEWSIAAVLKTVEPQGSGGSNPSFSAERDFSNKKGEVPFSLLPLSLDKRAISAITEFISVVRSTPFFLSYCKPEGNITFWIFSLLLIVAEPHISGRFEHISTAF